MRRYPTRHALLLAVAPDSVDRLTEAGIALRGLVEALAPLGARIKFLLRQPALEARTEQLDSPVEDFVRRAQHAGAVRRDAPVWWVVLVRRAAGGVPHPITGVLARDAGTGRP